MKQSVDLFPLHLRREPVVLGAGHIALGLGAAFVLFTSIWAVAAWRAGFLHDDVGRMRTELGRQTAHIGELAERYPPLQADADLVAETERLERERAAKGRVVALLARQELGNQVGFSPHLEVLARHALPGIWLEHIAIANGGEELALAGVATRGERVPQLVQVLGASDAFRGSGFRSLVIERVEETDRELSFTLSARAEPAP